MISDLTVRLITTALFGYAAAYCVYRLVTPLDTIRRVDHFLHLAMAVAMIAMAWPSTASFALTPLAAFFAGATLWFVGRAATSRDHALACGYHAVMMAAMVWMYAVMAGWTDGTDHSSHSMNMSEMDMTGMDMSGMEHSAGTPGWVAGVSLTLTVTFAVAALVWLSALFTANSPHVSTEVPAGHPTTAVPRLSLRTAAVACEVAMAAGMSVMMAML